MLRFDKRTSCMTDAVEKVGDEASRGPFGGLFGTFATLLIAAAIAGRRYADSTHSCLAMRSAAPFGDRKIIGGSASLLPLVHQFAGILDKQLGNGIERPIFERDDTDGTGLHW